MLFGSSSSDKKPTKKGCGEFNYHNENTFSNIFPCGTPAESARAKGRSGGRGGGGGGSCDRGGGDEGIGGGGSHRNGDGSGGGSGSDMMVSPPRRRGRTYGDDGGGGGSDGGGDYGSGSGGGGGHELVGSPLRNMVKVTDGSGRRVGSPVGNRVRIRDRGGDGGGGGMEVLSCPRRREKKGCKGGSGGGSGGGGGGGTGTGGGDGGRSGGVLETARASVQLGLSRKAGRSGGDGKSGMGCGKPVISGSLGRVISSGCGSSPGYSGTGLGSRRGLGVRGTRLGSRDRLQQGRRHDERPFVVNGGMGGGGSYGADRGVGGGGRGGYGDAGVVETEGMVLFWKAPACFAQWTPSMFEVDGTTYYNAEQWMMASKARHFRDRKTLRQIMNTEDPREMKALGRLVKDFDASVWDDVGFDLVVKGNLEKFRQNPIFRDTLLATGSKILAEASPFDNEWGIGLHASDPDALVQSRWPGFNKLGEALMDVRTKLREETPAFLGWGQG